MELVYLAHPFACRYGEAEYIYSRMRAAVRDARWAAGHLIGRGFAVINPLALSDDIEYAAPTVRDWLRIDLRLVRSCDSIVLCPGWERSTGCRIEYRYARLLGKRVYVLALGDLTVMHERRVPA
jgi:hypothetical protein